MSDSGIAIILEDVNHKFDAILEGQQAMAHVPSKLDGIDGRLRNVESDLRTIKLVVTGRYSQLDDHETRLASLERPTG